MQNKIMSQYKSRISSKLIQFVKDMMNIKRGLPVKNTALKNRTNSKNLSVVIGFQIQATKGVRKTLQSTVINSLLF
jgi:hypothetical protein